MTKIKWEDIEVRESNVKELYDLLPKEVELSSFKHISREMLAYIEDDGGFGWVSVKALKKVKATELDGEAVGRNYVDIGEFYLVDSNSRKVIKDSYNNLATYIENGLTKFVEDKKIQMVSIK